MSHDIDLIPADYRACLRSREWLRRIGFAYLALGLGLGLARAGVAWETHGRSRENARMEAVAAAAQERRAHLEGLRQRRSELEKQLALLEGLRGGVEARRMLQAVDRALDENVWFVDWKFRRAGALVDREPNAVATGYFLVVPAGKKEEGPKAWRMDTHMEIRARAVDHSSLANFVSRLVAQPEVESVRVLNTRVRPYLEAQAVEFELAVVVRGRA